MIGHHVSCLILSLVSWQLGMVDIDLKRLSGNVAQDKFTLWQEHSVSNTENTNHINRK